MNETIQLIKTKRFAMIFLTVALILSMFVLYTPQPVSKDDKTQFSAVRAAEHIEVISREPHSWYDQTEIDYENSPHGKARQYVIDTLTDYLGAANVEYNKYEYSIQDVKDTLTDLNNKANSDEHDLSKVVHPVRNVLGKLPGTNEEGILLMAHYDSRGHVGRYGEQGRSYGAMDDGYGVSTMLELAYILKDLNPTNTVYFLFTDAEEVGLYGAVMASVDAELMSKAKFVINLESRGRYGATYMFETSKNNAKVIDLYKKAGLPVTYSMATAVYSVMPNYTDFTPMIDAGQPGLNFATLAGLDNYHSPLDSYENINLPSIQHMGVQVEPIVREFMGNAKYIENDYFVTNSNQVFFTLFAGVMISYSNVFAIILCILLVVGFGVVTFLAIKEKTISKEMFTKLLPKGLLVFVGMIVVGLVYSNIVAFIGKTPFSVTYTRVSGTELPTLVLMIALTLFLIKTIKKAATKEVLYLGIAVNLLLTILTTFTLEGASFLFAFTTLFGLIALAIDYIPSKIAKFILLGLSYTFLLFMIVPLLYSFYMALTVGGVVVLTVLLTINSYVTLPIIKEQFKLSN